MNANTYVHKSSILNEHEEEQPVEQQVEQQDEQQVEQQVKREYPLIENFKFKKNYKIELQNRLTILYDRANRNNEQFKQIILNNIEKISNINKAEKNDIIENLNKLLSPLESTNVPDMNEIANYIITIRDPIIEDQLLTKPTPEFQIPDKRLARIVVVGQDSKIKTSSVVVNTGYGPKPTQNDRFGAGEAAAKAAGAGAKAEAGAAGEGGERGDGERGEGERDEEEEAAKKKKKAEEDETHTILYDKLSAIFAQNKKKMELVHTILTKKNKIAKLNDKIKDGGKDNTNNLVLLEKLKSDLQELLKKPNNSHTSNTDTYNEKERIKKLKNISGSLLFYISNIPDEVEKNKFYEMLEGNMDESALFEFLEILFPFQEKPAQVALSDSSDSSASPASQVASPLHADKTTLLQTLSHQMLKEKLTSLNLNTGESTSRSPSPPSPPSPASSASLVVLQTRSEANTQLNVWSQKLSQNFLQEKLMSLKSEQRSMRKNPVIQKDGYEDEDEEGYEEEEEEIAFDATDSEDEGSVQKLSQKILQGKLTSLNIGEPASLQGNQSPRSGSSHTGSPRSSHTDSPRSSQSPSPEANTQLNVWHQQLSQKILREKLMSLASQNPLGNQTPIPAESQPSSQVGSPTGSRSSSPRRRRSSSPTGSRSGSPTGRLQSGPSTPQRRVKNSDEPYLFKKYNDHKDEEYAIYYKDDKPSKDDNPDVNIANIKTDKCFNYFIYKNNDKFIIKPVKNYYSLTDILTIIYNKCKYIIIISKNANQLYPGVLYQYKDYNKINLIFIYDNSEINIIYGNLFDDTTNTEDGSVHIIPIEDEEYHQIKNEIYPYGQDTKSLSNISSALLSFKIKSIQRTQ